MASTYCDGTIGAAPTYRQTDTKIAGEPSLRAYTKEFDFIAVSESVNLFYTVGSLPSSEAVIGSDAKAAPQSRSLFYLSAGFGAFSVVVTGFALVSESVIASSISAFSLCGALIAGLAWLEKIKRERE